jgi:hypothetical protein
VKAYAEEYGIRDDNFDDFEEVIARVDSEYLTALRAEHHTRKAPDG